MSNIPWYTQIFSPDIFGDNGCWTIKPDGTLVRKTEEELSMEHGKSRKHKWIEVLGGYEIVLETPGIEDFDYFKFDNEKLLLRYSRALYGRRWLFNESLELPVSINEIDSVDYESCSGITRITLTTKSAEKDIKIVNRNKKNNEPTKASR